MNITLDQSEVGSIVSALYFIGSAIIIAAILRAIFNK